MAILCFEHRLPCQCFKPKVVVDSVLLARSAAVEVAAMTKGSPSPVTLSPKALDDLALIASSYITVGDALIDFMGKALTEARMLELVAVVAKLKEAGFGAGSR